MYGATRSVLTEIAAQGTTFAQRGDALNAIKMLMSYEFVFILHVVKEIMDVTNVLCRALQQKNQDIINAMHLVSTTNVLIQKLRSDGWENLLGNVRSFCERYIILIPNMVVPYFDVLKSLRQQGKQKQTVTMEHHYKVEIFTAAIDQQLQELNNRFSEQATELLILSASLNPRDGYKSFNIENICLLAEKYYPEDFLEEKKICLKCELQHYGLDIPTHPDLKNMCTLGDLCHGLVTTGKDGVYSLVASCLDSSCIYCNI